MLRLLKVARYSTGLQTMVEGLNRSMQALVLLGGAVMLGPRGHTLQMPGSKSRIGGPMANACKSCCDHDHRWAKDEKQLQPIRLVMRIYLETLQRL